MPQFPLPAFEGYMPRGFRLIDCFHTAGRGRMMLRDCRLSICRLAAPRYQCRLGPPGAMPRRAPPRNGGEFASTGSIAAGDVADQHLDLRRRTPEPGFQHARPGSSPTFRAASASLSMMPRALIVAADASARDASAWRLSRRLRSLQRVSPALRRVDDAVENTPCATARCLCLSFF